MTTAKERTILIEHREGNTTEVGNIPACSKITYGPIQPGSKGGYSSGENVLRIYTTANNQLAVFRDVKSFRDLSLLVTRHAVQTDIDVTETHGPTGSTSSRAVRKSRIRLEDDDFRLEDDEDD